MMVDYSIIELVVDFVGGLNVIVWLMVGVVFVMYNCLVFMC